MTHSSFPSRKPVVKQPAANPPRLPTAKRLDAPQREKTTAEIVEEKMAAMAAHPNAITVYMTEKGIDAKGWDTVCPEYKIFDAALKGGYGWWDLTEGAGRHLLPKPRPYKIVHITSAELRAIRAKETEEDATTKAAKEAECAAAQAAELLAAERKAMAAEDERANVLRLEAWHAEQAAAKAEAERLQIIDIATDIVLEEIRALPEHYLYQDYLVDYIVDRVAQCPKGTQDPIIERVCTAIEKEGLIFYTPVCSPDLPSATPVNEPPPMDLPAAVPLLQDDLMEFVRQPPFILFGTLYTPVALLSGLRMYMPAIMLDALLKYALAGSNLQAFLQQQRCGPDCLECNQPQTPLPPPLPKDCGFTDCKECYPPPPPLPQDCGFADCEECFPPPPSDLTPLLPTPIARPLPLIQARLAPQQTSAAELMKNIKIRKLRMPRTNRIQQILRSIAK